MYQIERYRFIDILETLACVFVVLYHTFLLDINVVDKMLSISCILAYFMHSLFSLCCPLFFVCNGYLLFLKEFDMGRHIKKMLRLLIILTVWSVIATITRTVASGEFSINSIKQNATGFWFINAIIAIYVVFPAMKAVFDNSKAVYRYILYSVVLITFILPFINQVIEVIGFAPMVLMKDAVVELYGYSNPYMSWYAYSFAYFILGGEIATPDSPIVDLYTKMSWPKRGLTTVGMIICLNVWGIVLSKKYGEVWDNVWNGYSTVWVLVMTFIVFLIVREVDCGRNYKLPKCIEFVSKNSLEIYVIHSVLVFASYEFVDGHVEGGIYRLFINVLYTMVVFVISVWLAKYISIIHKFSWGMR